jgi:hypothetical protein
MIKLKNIVESILKERISDIVYHATYLDKGLSILKQDAFVLATVTGTKSEKEKNKGRNYYMSLARSMSSGYSLFRDARRIIFFKLDGKLLGNNLKGGPIDYWGGMHMMNVSNMTNKEIEDRIFSDKPKIENASKYIKEVYIFLGEKKFKRNKDEKGIPTGTYTSWYELESILSDNTKNIILQILVLLKKRGIPFYIYFNKSDLLSNNKKNAVNFKQLNLGDRKGNLEYSYDRSDVKKYRYLEKYQLLIYLYYFNNINKIKNIVPKHYKDIVGSKVYDITKLHKNDFLMDEYIRSLKSEISNEKSKNNNYINRLNKIMRDEKLTNLEDLVTLISKKWDKIL